MPESLREAIEDIQKKLKAGRKCWTTWYMHAQSLYGSK